LLLGQNAHAKKKETIGKNDIDLSKKKDASIWTPPREGGREGGSLPRDLKMKCKYFAI